MYSKPKQTIYGKILHRGQSSKWTIAHVYILQNYRYTKMNLLHLVKREIVNIKQNRT
jgi:hypothetical protein